MNLMFNYFLTCLLHGKCTLIGFSSVLLLFCDLLHFVHVIYERNHKVLWPRIFGATCTCTCIQYVPLSPPWPPFSRPWPPVFTIGYCQSVSQWLLSCWIIFFIFINLQKALSDCSKSISYVSSQINRIGKDVFEVLILTQLYGGQSALQIIRHHYTQR